MERHESKGVIKEIRRRRSRRKEAKKTKNKSANKKKKSFVETKKKLWISLLLVVGVVHDTVVHVYSKQSIACQAR
jgi:hypothetical protein